MATTESALTIITADIYSVAEQFDRVLCDKSINFEREAGFAIQCISANDFTMRTAMNNRQSVVNAVTNIAAIGISLNPAKKQAYLVPMDGKIVLMISYMGLVDLAVASGSVLWAKAEVVYEADTLTLHGFDKPPEHKYNPFAKDRGAPVGVYCVVKTADGDYLTETMAIDDVYAIRDRSSAWKNSKKGPWLTDESEMCKKTCIKRAAKLWPRADRTSRFERAVHYLNNDAGEGLAELAKPDAAPGAILAMRAGALDGIGDDIPPDRKAIIQAVSRAVNDHFAADDIIGAFEEASGITDGDEKAALWKLLDSKVRTALKKHGASIKETANQNPIDVQATEVLDSGNPY